MTIRELINQQNIRIKEKEYRSKVEDLQSRNAPKFILDPFQQDLDKLMSGTFRVNGLARKFPVGDVEITSYQKAFSMGYYHNGRYRSERPTEVYKIITEKGIYYYDLMGNKISSNPYELDCSVAGIFR